MSYAKLGYAPSGEDLVCEYYFEPARGVSPRYAVEQLAAESSIGTWTTIATMKPAIARRLAPKIFSLKKNRAKIAYPAELFEEGNAPQILSAVAGNVFGMRVVENLRLEDISFPKKLLESFRGPALGVPGVRKLLKIAERPLCGTIIKPKVGLSAKEHARVAYDCWSGGLDLVKDDENLASMKFNEFEERVTRTLEAMERAQSETGEKKLCVLNTTAESKEMICRAQFIRDQGGNTAMIDILTAGWSALQTLRNANLGLVIHAHRAGHAALTRNPRHGISMLAIAKLARAIGVDSLHVGAIFGKMEGAKEEVLAIKQGIQASKVKADERAHVLAQEWFGVKPVFAVASGGLHPGVLPQVVEAMGSDVFLQAGGGCHGHPKGTFAGAKAIRQAIDAVTQGISLKEYAEDHVELRQAIDKWGFKPPKASE